MLCQYYHLKRRPLVVLCCWAALTFMIANGLAPTAKPATEFGVMLSDSSNSTLPPLLKKLTLLKSGSSKMKPKKPLPLTASTTTTTISTTTINTILKTFTPPSQQDVSEFELLHGTTTSYNSYPSSVSIKTPSRNVVKAWVRGDDGKTFPIEIEDDFDYGTTSTTTTTAKPLIVKKTKPRRANPKTATTTTTTISTTTTIAPTREKEGEEREDKEDTGPRAIASMSDYGPLIETYWYTGSDGSFQSRQTASGGTSSLSSINLATPMKALALLLGITYFL